MVHCNSLLVPLRQKRGPRKTNENTCEKKVNTVMLSLDANIYKYIVSIMMSLMYYNTQFASVEFDKYSKWDLKREICIFMSLTML